MCFILRASYWDYLTAFEYDWGLRDYSDLWLVRELIDFLL